MKLSKLLNFNLEFQQIQSRQKGLFTFYHEQINQSQVEEKTYTSDENQPLKNQSKHHNKNIYQRKTQKPSSKNQIKKTNPDTQVKQNKERIFSQQKKKMFYSKSLHKQSSLKLGNKQYSVNFSNLEKNSKTVMSIFNFDEKQYFKNELNKSCKQKTNFKKKEIDEKNNEVSAKLDNSLLKKLTLIKKINGKSSANYLFPIFDQKKQEYKNRKFQNKTKVQSKRLINNQNFNKSSKSNNFHNFSVHVAGSQKNCSQKDSKQAKDHQNSYNFGQFPNLRKRQQTLTYRLRQYLKNQSNTVKNKEKEKQVEQPKKFQQSSNQYIKPYKYQQKLQQILLKKIKNQKLRS